MRNLKVFCFYLFAYVFIPLGSHTYLSLFSFSLLKCYSKSAKFLVLFTTSALPEATFHDIKFLPTKSQKPLLFTQTDISGPGKHLKIL